MKQAIELKNDSTTLPAGTYTGTCSGYEVELTERLAVSQQTGDILGALRISVSGEAVGLPVTIETINGNRGISDVEAVVDIGGRIRVWTL